MERLKGKKFLKIEDSEFGDIKITFEDGTIAYFNYSTYPDGTMADIDLSEIKKEDLKEVKK